MLFKKIGMCPSSPTLTFWTGLFSVLTLHLVKLACLFSQALQMRSAVSGAYEVVGVAWQMHLGPPKLYGLSNVANDCFALGFEVKQWKWIIFPGSTFQLLSWKNYRAQPESDLLSLSSNCRRSLEPVFPFQLGDSSVLCRINPWISFLFSLMASFPFPK